jgi:hypothetical protein
MSIIADFTEIMDLVMTGKLKPTLDKHTCSKKTPPNKSNCGIAKILDIQHSIFHKDFATAKRVHSLIKQSHLDQ